MNGVVIFKLTGSGNDFVFVDGRATPVSTLTPELIRAVCARRTGVGADGLVVLEPGSRPGRVRFHFFNNDGSPADMCGNAALCATRLAAWLELAPANGMLLETNAGTLETRCLSGPGERAEILLPPVGEITTPDIALAPGERSIHLTRVGVPHLVVVVEDVATVPLLERGRALREHAAIAPEGANINFVAKAGRAWTMRTYERGVEDETLACGTGAAACAAVLLGGNTRLRLPWDVRTATGAVLTISSVSPNGVKQLERVRLAGEGRMVFRGVLGEF